MSGIVIHGQLRGIDEALHEFSAALDEQVRAALVEIGGAVAHTAQGTHPWQNRTGELQASTAADPDVWGNFSDAAGLALTVAGNTDYGEYLEDKPQWAYLWPAWEANEAYAEQDLDRAVQRACDSTLGAR